MEKYDLEQSIWDEKEFNLMGWHDATIWSMLANSDEYEYLIDLDYIFKWVEPEGSDKYYKFWVSPATLVYENASDIIIDIKSPQGIIEISDLHMENPQLTPNGKFTEYTYRLECQEGVISIKATGYKMYVRHKPKLVQYQSLELKERGGVSFERKLKII